MTLLDVESKLRSDWRNLAENLNATNEDIMFLESRKHCHESPTQHVLNVFETMKLSLTNLRDRFIDLKRDDIVQMLNLEIGSVVVDSPTAFDCQSKFRETLL